MGPHLRPLSTVCRSGGFAEPGTLQPVHPSRVRVRWQALRPTLVRPVTIGMMGVLVLVIGIVVGVAKQGSTGQPYLPAGCQLWLMEGAGTRGSCLRSQSLAPLRELAEQRQIRLGSAVNATALADADYRAVLAREFNAVTAETAMKWSAVEPERGRFDRSAADDLVAFAQEHGQEVYGHALVWHKQVPEWVTDGDFSARELREVLRGHIHAEVSYFQGKVWAWDVVNEALDEDGALRDNLWLRRLGPGYIADALRWAREADPDVKLFLNDYGIEGINPKSDAMYALVSQLLAEGVPIDGVGFQVHWGLRPLPNSMVANLERFAALGVDVVISELDVRLPDPASGEDFRRQAGLYAEVVAACLAVPRCISITVWGFTDAYSWVPEHYPGRGHAAIFDAELEPKPAYTAVAEVLWGRRPSY